MAIIKTNGQRKSPLAALILMVGAMTLISVDAEAQTRQREVTRGTYAPPVLEKGTARPTATPNRSQQRTASKPAQTPQRAEIPQPAEVVRPVNYDIIEIDSEPPVQSEPSVLEMGPESYLESESYAGPYDAGGYCDSRGCDSCGCNQCAPCGAPPCYPCFGFGLPCHRMFGSAEYSMYWRRGQRLPPLITTSPADTPVGDAGELGQPTTTLLVGGRFSSDMRSGGRAQLGIWMDDFQCNSILLRFWAVGEESNDFFADQTTAPFVAVPFNNAGLNNQPDAFLIVEPNETIGNVGIRTRSEIYGGDVLLRRHWGSALGGRSDMFWGYQTARINEDLTLSIDSIGLEGGTREGQRLQITDAFDAKNEFHGATFGFDSFYREGCWSWQLLAKIGFGSMNREAVIRGNTIRTSNDISATSDEGFFARDSNIGRFSSSKFSVAPEVNLKLGYAIHPGLDFTFGYNFQAFTNVIQPGALLDTTTTDLDTATVGRPAVRFSDSSYWIQSLNFGLAWQY